MRLTEPEIEMFDEKQKKNHSMERELKQAKAEAAKARKALIACAAVLKLP